MKHTSKKSSPTTLTLTVTLDGNDLKAIRPLTVAKLSKNLKVSGFRAGKVPASVAEKNIDPVALESQLVEDAINKHTIDILTSENVSALSRPEVDVKNFEPGKTLEYTATVEILPEVKLGDYKKLKGKTEKVSVSAKEIEEIIERMRTQFAEKKAVKRAAKDGDEVIIDFTGKKDGTAFDGGAAKDYRLALGSGSFIPGFEAAIVGHQPGEEFTIPLEFPKDYQAKELAGQKVEFDIVLKAVEEVVLPKVDDAFAAKCGPFKTVAELKADIKKELTAQKERSNLEQLKDSLLAQLVDKSTIPLPESVVEDQMRSIEQDMTQNLMYRGQTLEQYLEAEKLTHDEWLARDVRPSAEKRVQVGLVLAELSKAENIEVNQEELDARHAELMKQYNDPSLRQRFDSPEERRNLANRLMTEKTVDRLVLLNVQ